MKRRINNLFKIFIVLSICFIGNTVFAVDVSNWTDLKTNVEAGNSVKLTGNIMADGTSTTINIGSSYSPVVDLANKSISGNDLIQIFNNAGTLSISDGTIEKGKSALNGGAIYNNGTITYAKGTFSSNSAGRGGAIYNISIGAGTGIITEIASGTIFSSNIASVHGGAIYSYSGSITINNGKFTSNNAGSTGGAIYNNTNGTFTINTGTTFEGNTADAGGAISNYGKVNLTGSSFNSNVANQWGGGIFNRGKMDLTNSSFSKNLSLNYCGAIYNDGTLTVSGGTFSENKALQLGGAIYNTGDNGDVTLTNVTFSKNSITNGDGGAVYNGADLTIIGGSFSDNTTSSSSLEARGGAIFNFTDKSITITDGTTFTNNSASSASNMALGGAIANYGTIDITGATFTGNSITSSAGYSGGGAIYNQGTTTITNGSFSSNSAATTGGAIFNAGTLNIIDSSFTGNTAGTLGGAIYHFGGTTTITANASDVNFSGNTQSGGAANDIYIEANYLDLDAKANRKITFAGGISSGSSYSSTVTKKGSGELILSGDNSGFTQTFTQTEGTTSVSNKFFAGTSNIQGGTLDLKSGSSLGVTSSILLTNSGTTLKIEDGATQTAGSSIAVGSGAILEVNTSTGNTLNLNSTVTGIGTISKTAGGTLNISNDQSGFTGTFNQAAGITDVTNGKFFGGTSNIKNGILTLEGDSTLVNSSKIYLTDEGTNTEMDITQTGSSTHLTLASGSIIDVGLGTTLNINNKTSGIENLGIDTSIRGGGSVNLNNESGAGTQSINDGGDNHLFTGTLTQAKGDSYFTSGFFGGTSKIEGGSLNFQGGAHLYSGSSITLTNSATMDIGYKGSPTMTMDTGSSIYLNGINTKLNFGNFNPLDLYTQLTGTGTISNTGGSTVNFRGDNSEFTGTFNQTAGTSNVYNNFFGGTSTIEGGTLNFNDGARTTSGSSITLSNTATMNINTTTGNTFDLNSAITGSGTQVVTKNNGGTVNINGAVSGITYNQNAGTTNVKNAVTNSTINIYDGTLALSKESNIDGTVNIGLYGSDLNTQNNLIGPFSPGILTLAGGSTHNWLLDVDLANIIGDQLNPGSVSGTGLLTISSINLLSDSGANITLVNVANLASRDHINLGVSSVDGALFRYGVSYDSSSGNLNFTKNGFAPGAITSDVAQTQAFLLQTAIDRQFFANMESFMSFPLSTRESTICCALSNGDAYTGAACPISGNGTFSPIYQCDLNRGIWIKDFVSFENIPLRNGPNVSTIEYGTLIGMDAPLTYLKRGWVGNTSAYVGYLGSNQNYDGVGVSQNGGLVGLAENFVKGNNFLTLMAHVGSSMGIANTQYGNDYFNSIFAGGAAKGGHNFEYKEGEYIVQPNLMLAYTYTYTPTYNTAAGIEMTSRPLNAIQVAPGLRLIKNLIHDKGQVYLIGNFVYNIMDNTKFNANDVQLPELSIAPYFEYGIGYQRIWKERFTGFFQTLLRGGGRNGISLQFGLRWAI